MSGDPPHRLHLLRNDDAAAADERRARLVTWEPLRTPSARPERLEVENEIVGFVCDLVAAPSGAVGTVATSLFEAALLVVRGALDARRDVARPTLVLPSSAHPAYLDAARALGVTAIPVVVEDDGRVPVDLLAEAVTHDTVLVVASAPSYVHGVVDPIGRLGGVTMVSQVPLHVDASQGGWLLAHDRGRGHPWGMEVPGVTSVTLDVVPEVDTDLCVTVFRSAAHRTPAHLATSMPPAGGEAAAPASMVRAARSLRELGRSGCADHAAHRLEAARAMVDGLPVVLGVDTVVEPASATVTLRADGTCDVFTVADEVRRRRQSAEVVLSAPGRPALLRVEAPSRPELVTDLLTVLAQAANAARMNGPAELDAALALRLQTAATGEDVVAAAPQLVSAAMVLDRLDTRDGDPTASRTVHLLLDAADQRVRPVLAQAWHDLATKPVRGAPPDPVQTPAVVRTESSE